MKQPTDEEIKQFAIEFASRWKEVGLFKDIADSVQVGAKWARDQQIELDGQEIETLKSKAYALDTLWDPIVDYAQSHKIDGLRLGDSISAFVLKLLKERTL